MNNPVVDEIRKREGFGADVSDERIYLAYRESMTYASINLGIKMDRLKDSVKDLFRRWE